MTDPLATSSRCLDDAELFALALGELDDEQLRRAEAHLSQCANCREVLSTAAAEIDKEGSGRPQSTEPNASQVGDATRSFDGEAPVKLERYELRQLVGAGAAGVVYRAFDPVMQRDVAVKVFRTDLGQGFPMSDRTRREAHAMAQLSHQNVVTAFDIGVSDERVYIVMEFIDGSTLASWLKAEARSLDAILGVFIDAGRGLVAAHAKGVVHRDFKPQNVLIGNDGRVCVSDFGLARVGSSEAPAGLPGTTTVKDATMTRGLLGTPAYMAPEVFQGRTGDARSDQFSFCVALAEAAGGVHPFRADDAGVTLQELAARQSSGLLESLSELPPGLRAALTRGLSVAPDQRYPTMSELLEELEQVRTRRRTRPGRYWVGLAAAMGVGLVVALIAARDPGASVSADSPPLQLKTPLNPSSVSSDERAPALAVPLSKRTSAMPSGKGPGDGGLSTRRAKHRTPRGKSDPAARRSSRKAAPSTTASPGQTRYKDWLKDPF